MTDQHPFAHQMPRFSIPASDLPFSTPPFVVLLGPIRVECPTAEGAVQVAHGLQVANGLPGAKTKIPPSTAPPSSSPSPTSTVPQPDTPAPNCTPPPPASPDHPLSPAGARLLARFGPGDEDYHLVKALIDRLCSRDPQPAATITTLPPCDTPIPPPNPPPALSFKVGDKAQVYSMHDRQWVEGTIDWINGNIVHFIEHGEPGRFPGLRAFSLNLSSTSDAARLRLVAVPGGE